MTKQEAKKQRDKLSNDTRPMVPTKQVWRPKQIQDAVASTPITEAPAAPKEDDATAITSSATLLTSPSLGQISESVDALEEEDDMLDYESTPVHEGMDIKRYITYLLSFVLSMRKGRWLSWILALKMQHSRSQKTQ